MPSVIHPRSGPFPIYQSPNAPASDVGLFTVAKTGVNLKASGISNIFTVPTGRTFIGTTSFAIVTAVTSGGAGTQQYLITESGGNANMLPPIASASATPTVGRTYSTDPRGSSLPGSVCTAGNNVVATIQTSHAGSNAVTGTVFVTGFYSS